MHAAAVKTAAVKKTYPRPPTPKTSCKSPQKTLNYSIKSCYKKQKETNAGTRQDKAISRAIQLQPRRLQKRQLQRNTGPTGIHQPHVQNTRLGHRQHQRMGGNLQRRRPRRRHQNRRRHQSPRLLLPHRRLTKILPRS